MKCALFGGVVWVFVALRVTRLTHSKGSLVFAVFAQPEIDICFLTVGSVQVLGV